jgi:hypothetical protein
VHRDARRCFLRIPSLIIVIVGANAKNSQSAHVCSCCCNGRYHRDNAAFLLFVFDVRSDEKRRCLRPNGDHERDMRNHDISSRVRSRSSFVVECRKVIQIRTRRSITNCRFSSILHLFCLHSPDVLGSASFPKAYYETSEEAILCSWLAGVNADEYLVDGSVRINKGCCIHLRLALPIQFLWSNDDGFAAAIIPEGTR